MLDKEELGEALEDGVGCLEEGCGMFVFVGILFIVLVIAIKNC